MAENKWKYQGYWERPEANTAKSTLAILSYEKVTYMLQPDLEFSKAEHPTFQGKQGDGHGEPDGIPDHSPSSETLNVVHETAAVNIGTSQHVNECCTWKSYQERTQNQCIASNQDSQDKKDPAKKLYPR